MDLKSIFKNKKYNTFFILLIIIFSLLYFIFRNLSTSLSIINFPLFSFKEKLNLFFISLFDISELKNTLMLLLFITFIISISLFFLFIYILYKNSKKINNKKNIWSTFSIFISIVGLSCASCGIGLLASILYCFGASSLILYFPLHGLVRGFLGVLFLNISNYFLYKRIKNPFVC